MASTGAPSSAMVVPRWVAIFLGLILGMTTVNYLLLLVILLTVTHK